MGFSFLTQALLRSGLPEAPWTHLVASLGYSVGFTIVVLGRQQLFTESTLTAVLPALTNRDWATAKATLRLWTIVLAANILGTVLFAAAIRYGDFFPPEVPPNLAALARETVEHPFWTTLLKAVFAGWLIALMIWLLPSARSARLLIIVGLTYVVALGRFSHIIAGSAEAAFAVLDGEASISDYLGAFFVPTLIGNTLGGVSLVALLNHAPVRSEIEDGPDGRD
jgi:formate/nitrite transporter FocA (FNT family)